MQINPHFLYNTLQTINWRGKLLKDEPISLMTESRANCCGLLQPEKQGLHPGAGTGTGKILYEHSGIRSEDTFLQYKVNIPPELLDTYLPKFTLQFWIENAIHYTLEDDSDECFISIQAHQELCGIVIMFPTRIPF